LISWRANRHPVERSFQAVLTVAAEQQPCCVQVVEWIGLVDSGRLYLDVHFIDLDVHFL
jgi:hypothetical protein